MDEDRVDQKTALERLKALRNLSSILGEEWISQEYQKPVERWSLITGWLSKKEWNGTDSPFGLWLEDLDFALGCIKESVSDKVWHTIQRKVRAHNDRSDFKGTLSEIAICMFLAKHRVPFGLETKLSPDSDKDVDISASFGAGEPLHIEVQWLSPSERSDLGAIIASWYGEAYSYEFDYESYRIKIKIHDKTPKFTEEHVTFVALNCTLCPELGGDQQICLIRKAVLEAFTGRDLQGNPSPYKSSRIDTAIRSLVDGVVWFELRPGTGLLPVRRGSCLNPVSPHKDKLSISKFLQVWNS